MMPNKTWSLTRIADFCTSTLRRLAADAWAMGKALDIARAKHTTNREWLAWLKTNIPVSCATAYRYMHIATSMSLVEASGKKLKDIYSEKKNTSQREKKVKAPNGKPAWAVDDVEDDQAKSETLESVIERLNALLQASIDGGDPAFLTAAEKRELTATLSGTLLRIEKMLRELRVRAA